MLNLVKYHDTNLPGWRAAQKGDPPSDKAWNRLARRLDLKLLCLFMVADRVDYPGGWRTNQPLVWFLDEVKRRKLLASELMLNDGPAVAEKPVEVREVSAGCVLVHKASGDPCASVIRRHRNRDEFELPEGHVELNEALQIAALRELREETSLSTPVALGAEVGMVEYEFEEDGSRIRKTVHFFLAVTDVPSVAFNPQAGQTKELRWVTAAELAALPLVKEELRPIIGAALTLASNS